jgi:hypothetical protein
MFHGCQGRRVLPCMIISCSISVGETLVENNTFLEYTWSLIVQVDADDTKH